MHELVNGVLKSEFLVELHCVYNLLFVAVGYFLPL